MDSFAVLEPIADGFRNYVRKGTEEARRQRCCSTRRNCSTLTAPEMTVLIGGMRALGANVGHSQHGVFTKRPETLTNDFFVNLLDMGTKWAKSEKAPDVSRRPRSQDRRTQVDGHHRRPRLRIELPASRHRRGLRQQRRASKRSCMTSWLPGTR